MGPQPWNRMWILSLFIFRFFTLWLVQAGDPGLAMSYCSHSFRFDQLCPDPRFGSQEEGAPGGRSPTGYYPPDTFIALNTNTNMNSNHRGRGNSAFTSGGNGYGNNGMPSSSSMSTKDPSETSCEFHKNGETAVVKSIHVTETPWHFRQANPCNHIVKFQYNLFNYEGAGSGILGGESSYVRSKEGEGSEVRESVCHNEFGYRTPGSQDQDTKAKDEYQGQEEEIAKKMNVYFWHNFTLRTHSAEFVDTITNYHWSKDDINCAKDKSKPQYVQIAVLVSKSGRCEAIVQQYKIYENRSPYGCTGTNVMIPYPIQFCGSYECSQISALLTSLKLHSRKDFGAHHKSSWNNKNKNNQFESGSGFQSSSSLSSRHHHHDTEDSNTYTEDGEEGLASGCTTTPATTTANQKMSHSVVMDGNSNEEEEEVVKEPVDWIEMGVRCAFPTMGVLLIFCVLYYLRSKTGKEICTSRSQSVCNGQPPDYFLHHPQIYHQGSLNSLDKNHLPL